MPQQDSAPLYRGETIAVPQAPVAQYSADNPFAELFAQSDVIRTEQADALQAALIERYEYGLEQTRAQRVAQVESETNAELIRLMSLPSGTAESPFNRDGTYKKGVIENFINKQAAKLNGFDKGFITDRAARGAQEANAKVAAAFRAKGLAAVMGAVTQRARDAAMTRIRTAQSTGNYGMANSEANSAYRANAISDAERESIVATNNQRAQLDAINAARDVADLSQAWEAIKKDATPVVRQAYLDRLNLLRNSIQNNFTMPEANQDTQEAPLVKGAAPKQLIDLWNKYNGNFTGRNRSSLGVQEARGIAPEIARIFIHDAEDTESIERYKDIMRRFGVTDDKLNSIVNARIQIINDSDFNVEDAINTLADNMVIEEALRLDYLEASSIVMDTNKIDRISELRELANNQPLDEKGNRKPLPEKEMRELAHLENERKTAKAKQAAIENRIKSNKQAIRKEILTRYSAWLAECEARNEKPTYRAKINEFESIAYKVAATIQRKWIDRNDGKQNAMEDYIDAQSAKQQEREREREAAKQALQQGDAALNTIQREEENAANVLLGDFPDMDSYEDYERFTQVAESVPCLPINKAEKFPDFSTHPVIYVGENHPLLKLKPVNVGGNNIRIYATNSEEMDSKAITPRVIQVDTLEGNQIAVSNVLALSLGLRKINNVHMKGHRVIFDGEMEGFDFSDTDIPLAADTDIPLAADTDSLLPTDDGLLPDEDAEEATPYSSVPVNERPANFAEEDQ